MTTITVTGAIPEWDISDRLSKARKFAGLEQTELAEHIGISRSSVSSYENGYYTPGKPIVTMWAMTTGVDYDWLMHGDQLPRQDSNLQRTGYHQHDLSSNEILTEFRKKIT